ncbi:uncharacterized protein LOC111135226 isoform X1 [Crassostrea virginica]
MATSPPSSEAFESSSPAHDDSSFNTSISSIFSHATTIINNISSTNNVQTLSSISTDFTTASLHSSTSLMGYNTTPHPLTGKDRTVLVTLIVMGVIVPSVFIFVIVSICCRQRKMVKKRREQMLLRNQQDFAMDELPYSMRGSLAAGKL